MSVADWGRLAAEEPLAAAEILRSAGDLLQATGDRLVTKADYVEAMARTVVGKRRANRIRRQGYQRIALARAALDHAEDLYLRAAGNSELCSADPLRKPLET